MNRTPPSTVPEVSVVIPTRNRGAEVLMAVRSVLANQGADLELIVVDQSTDDSTARALEPILEDPRLLLIRSDSRGISAARNEGLAEARSDIIGLTDDDCEVPATWCRQLLESVQADPDRGVLFGNVVPGPHDTAQGFIPAALCDRLVSVSRVRDMHRIGGMGACMGIRRSVWETLGGFDERLGVGTRFGAGEEGEFVLRALLAGYTVAQTPAIEVVHHGFRSWQQGRQLIHRYWLGSGATLGIHLTASPGSVSAHLLTLAWGWLTGRSTVADSLGDRPHRWLRLTSFLRGLVAGLPLRPWKADR